MVPKDFRWSLGSLGCPDIYPEASTPARLSMTEATGDSCPENTTADTSGDTLGGKSVCVLSGRIASDTHLTSNFAYYLENQAGRLGCLRRHHPDRQADSGQFAARGDLRQQTRLLSRIGADKKFDPFQAAGIDGGGGGGAMTRTGFSCPHRPFRGGRYAVLRSGRDRRKNHRAGKAGCRGCPEPGLRRRRPAFRPARRRLFRQAS